MPPFSYEVRGAARGMISEEARQIPRGMLNNALIAVSVMVVNVLLASMAAYAFARMNFRGRQVLAVDEQWQFGRKPVKYQHEEE